VAKPRTGSTRTLLSAVEKDDTMVEDRGEHRYTFDLALSQEREAYVTNKLIAFNQSRSKADIQGSQTPSAPAPLHIYILNEEGTVVGGLIGRTHYIQAWLEISIIWVDESVRSQGLGRQLMAQAEAEARQRGCRYARAATSDFQAPDFYAKIGYSVYGRLENCPPGETVYYFYKEFI